MLDRELTIAIASGQVAVRVNTDEIADAMATISQVCRKKGWEMQVWSKSHGLIKPGKEAGATPEKLLTVLANFLTAPPRITADAKAGETEGHRIVPTVLVCRNFHIPFEQGREDMVAIIQDIVNSRIHGGPFDEESPCKFIVALTCPSARLPPEVDPLFHIIDHELPDETELGDILDGVSLSGNDEKMNPDRRRAIAKAAMGLTRLQAEGLFASSLLRSGSIEPADIWKGKSAILNKDGLVELHEGKQSYADIGGLTGAKNFLGRLLAHDELEEEMPEARARGVLCCGVPGSGKTLTAYCTGKEFSLPVLKVNPGNLKNKYVGDSEKATRKFFQIARRMAPVICIIDEVEKVMPAGTESGEGSSVDRNMLGSFLTAMQDIEEPVFWFFTCNSTDLLNEAFMRAERIDAIIYMRLPDPAQRADIWRIYLQKFFPAMVKGKPDHRHIRLSVPELLTGNGGTETSVRLQRRAQDLAAVMQTMVPAARKESLAEIARVDRQLAGVVGMNVIDDEGWTPAEIKSCCRLARRLGLSLFDTAKKIHHVCFGDRGREMLKRLDDWAVDNGALDAETGETFDPEKKKDDGDPHGEEEAAAHGKSRRKIQR
jgi:hypothetical protein